MKRIIPASIFCAFVLLILVLLLSFAAAFTQSSSSYDIRGAMPYIAKNSSSSSFRAVITIDSTESAKQSSTNYRLITGAIAGTTPFCGDGHKDPGEECDDDDFGGLTCVSFGYDSGYLSCSESCTIIKTGCKYTPAPSRRGGGGGFGYLPTKKDSVIRLIGGVEGGREYNIDLGDATIVTRISFVSDFDVYGVSAAVNQYKGEEIEGFSFERLDPEKYYEYMYLKISLDNLKGKVSNSKIIFKVLRSWIESKKATYDDVVVLKWNDNEWNELPTYFVNDDKTYAYFIAETDSFSYFSVAIKKKIISVKEEKKPIVIPKKEIPTPAKVMPVEEKPSLLELVKDNIKFFIYVIIGFVIFVLILIGTVAIRHRAEIKKIPVAERVPPAKPSLPEVERVERPIEIVKRKAREREIGAKMLRDINKRLRLLEKKHKKLVNLASVILLNRKIRKVRKVKTRFAMKEKTKIKKKSDNIRTKKVRKIGSEKEKSQEERRSKKKKKKKKIRPKKNKIIEQKKREAGLKFERKNIKKKMSNKTSITGLKKVDLNEVDMLMKNLDNRLKRLKRY
ncbi:hypothetical protein DRJ17_03795 [Candidatus Woesearchaeota archaeon]|mgnify:CR=1 FL=1|nr:MAG: hypothetical protein DRJ17_03795 [Candidatus Woesearchaeota archaeon]